MDKQDTSHIPFSADQQVALMKTAEMLLNTFAAEDLWSVILQAARRTLAADRTAVFLFEPEPSAPTCAAAEGLSPRYLETLSHNIQFAPSHALWQHKEPLVIADIHTDPRTEKLRDLMQAEGFKTYAAFPMLNAESSLLGAILAYRDQPHPFSASDLAAGQTLAHLCALGLKNIQLISQTRLDLLREQQLNEITRTLASALDLPTILGHVLHMAAEGAGADAGLLGLIIDHQVMTFYPYNIPENIVLRPAPRGRGIAWEVAAGGKTVHIPSYARYPNKQMRWVEAGITTLVGVPIVAADHCVGALLIFNLHQTDKQFSPREIALLESIGRQAGIAIQNARMYAEAQQRTAALRNALTRQAELDDLKNKFVQNVSHELRTPLGIIHGHAELLSSGMLGQMSEQQQNSVDVITRRIRMLIDLVDDLTAMLAAETQELRREQVDPTALIYSMLDEYRIQAQRFGVQLKAEVAENLPPILGDITHLRRMFDNLVSNAFKFTPEGGTVTIRLCGQGDQILIEVIDTGVGIPEEKLSRIFERFYQVDGKTTRKFSGTGLGLALVKEIVESHRGEVSATSETGAGTTFRVILPGHGPAANESTGK